MSERKKSVLRGAYYALNLTWGLPMTIIGALIGVGLWLCGSRSKTYGGGRCFEIGRGYGGFSVGLTFVVARGSGESVRRHELGHSIQNAVLGPFMPIAVGIPSAVRYWYRELRARLGKRVTVPYDGIWFEASASALGEKYLCIFERSSPETGEGR